MDEQAGQDRPSAPRGRFTAGTRLGVVAVLLLATLTGAWLTDRAATAHQQSRFDAEVRRIDSAIEQRMTAYVQVLRGGLGLFRASDRVTRADWRRYVDTLRLDQRYPGFKSLSYAPAVPDEELAAFVRRVRAEPRPPGLSVLRSMRDYALRAPAGSSGVPPVHSPILWVAPFSAENQVVLGVDMMREPSRRAAMLRAVRTQTAVLSPRLRLSGSENAEAGFIAYVPIPRGARTAGWLTAAFVTEDFMRGLLDADGTELRFELRDGSGPGEDALLYSTAGVTAQGGPRALRVDEPAFEHRGAIPMPGRAWDVHYVATQGFAPLTSRLAPWLVLLAGLLATLAFAVIGRAGERWRRQADLLAVQAEGLRRARAEAEEATRAKAAFLAAMSHEIRTPMNAVIGMSAVLMDTPMTAEQQGHASIIRSSGEHLLHVINDILDFSKLEAGKVELEDAPFSLPDCVASAVDLVAADALREGVDLGAEVDGDVPEWVVGDVSRVRQVLLNLVSNAVKFTPRGGRVRVGVRAEADGTVAFAVRDTGVGISPEQQERLFGAFEQADASTTRTHGGTGLGLSIARRLVEAMGGRLEVDSAVGEGAEFRFAVPLPAVATPAGTRSAEGHDDEEDVSSELGRRHPLRVLVAEDSPVNQLVARHLLGLLGYVPDIVGNGEEVLAAVGLRTYDVVLLDLRMPVLDGEDTARELVRRAGPDGRPRLVAMTADVLAEDRSAALAAGMDDFVPKPVTLAALAGALRRCPRRNADIDVDVGVPSVRDARVAPPTG